MNKRMNVIDLQRHAQLWHDVKIIFKNNNSQYIIFENNEIAEVHETAKIPDDNNCWFSVTPNSLAYCQMRGVHSVLFCIQNIGIINIPFAFINDYILSARKTVKKGKIVRYQLDLHFNGYLNNENCILICRKHHEKNKLLNPYLRLFNKNLEKAVSNDLQAIVIEENYEEGAQKHRIVSLYERDKRLRLIAIEKHGTKCKVCGFDFNEFYGKIGKDFIEVHHIKPIYKFMGTHSVNPYTDLTVVCSNCHRMIHRNVDLILSVEELRNIITLKHGHLIN